jgi:hypothetical protein
VSPSHLVQKSLNLSYGKTFAAEAMKEREAIDLQTENMLMLLSFNYSRVIVASRTRRYKLSCTIKREISLLVLFHLLGL